MPRFVLPLAILVATTAIGLAADTPEAVVAKQLAAMKAGEWEKFATSMREQDLKEIQTTIIGLLDSPESPAREQVKTFFGGKSGAELQDIPPATFYGLFMTGLSKANPTIKQSASTSDGEILGHIEEAPDKAHVLMRMTMTVGDARVTKMDVTTLQRDGDTWKALLKDNMRAIVTSLTKMLQSK